MDKHTLCELLECSVCMEPLNECNNKVLPCQHTFCRFCLDAIVAVENRLICPECRLSVDTRVDDLPSNVLLNRILSTLKNTTSCEDKKYRERRNKKGLSSILDYRSTDVTTPCAKALYNYKALENGDLSFKKDDILELLHQVDENWLVGKLNGKQGFLPANYIQIIYPLPSLMPMCKAKYDFNVGNEDWRKDCLTFKKNDRISVIRQIDKNWLEGSFKHRIGIFPSSFVELNDAAKLLALQNRSTFDILNQFTIWHQQDDVIPPTMMRSTNETITVASSCDMIGSSISRSSTQSTSKSHPNLSHTSKSSLIGSSELEKSNEKQTDVNLKDSDLPNFEGDGILPLYQALFNYLPQTSDELELEAGKTYVALKIKGGGWLLGKSVARGTVGLMPGNYVKFLRNWNYLEKGSPDLLPEPETVIKQSSKPNLEDIVIRDCPKKQLSSSTCQNCSTQTKQSSSCDDLITFDCNNKEKKVRNSLKDANRRSVNVEFLLSECNHSTCHHQQLQQQNVNNLPNNCNCCTSEITNSPSTRRQHHHLQCQHQTPSPSKSLIKSFSTQHNQLHHLHLQQFLNNNNNNLTPSRNQLRHSSIAYGVSSLIHRNMVKQKTSNQRCMSASASRAQ